MTARSETERRRRRRHSVSIEAKVRVPLTEHGSAALTAKATINDLSESGANVHLRKLRREHLPVFLRARRKCTLTFHLPTAEKVSMLAGEIVWVDIHADVLPYTANVGLEFKDMPDTEREKLARFISILAQQQATPSQF